MTIYKNKVKLLEELNTNAYDIFYAGCKGELFDLNSQKFVDYKAFNKITVESSAFGSSYIEYAFAYAVQYSKPGNPGKIVAFKLPKGKRFFELKNINDYKKIGINEKLASQLALIFKDCEPYFAINLNVDGHRVKAIPAEFKLTQQILKLFNPSEQTIEDILFKPQPDEVFNEVSENDFTAIYKQYIDKSIQKIFGKTKFHDIKNILSQESFSDKFEIYQRIGIDFKKEKSGKVQFQNYQSIFDSNGNVISVIFIKCYPKQLENDILFNNFKLLFKDKDQAYQIDRNSTDKVNAYMSLFKLVNEYIQNNYYSNTNNSFCNGINKIKQRLLEKYNVDEENQVGAHVYIDLIQYVLFTILTIDKLPNGDENPFIGVYSPEFRGYAEIHHSSSAIDDDDGNFLDKIPYGYPKRINANTICKDDKTIIITKPIIEDIECIGYSVDRFLDIQYAEINQKNSKTGKEKTTYNKIAKYTKLPHNLFSHAIEKLFKPNPQLPLSRFKKYMDKLLSTEAVKYYTKAYYYDSSEANIEKDYFYAQLFINYSYDKPIIDWLIIRHLKKQNDLKYNGLMTKSGKRMPLEQIMANAGKPSDRSKFEIIIDKKQNQDKIKHPVFGLTGASHKNDIGQRIFNAIMAYDQFIDYRNIKDLDKLNNIISIPKEEADQLLSQLPITDEIRKYLTKKQEQKGKNTSYELSLSDLNGQIDRDTGEIINEPKRKRGRPPKEINPKMIIKKDIQSNIKSPKIKVSRPLTEERQSELISYLINDNSQDNNLIEVLKELNVFDLKEYLNWLFYGNSSNHFYMLNYGGFDKLYDWLKPTIDLIIKYLSENDFEKLGLSQKDTNRLDIEQLINHYKLLNHTLNSYKKEIDEKRTINDLNSKKNIDFGMNIAQMMKNK